MADENHREHRLLDSAASRAIAALREPDYTFARTPNTVRQSVADVIESQATAIKQAYGLLWLYNGTDKEVHQARRVLQELMSKTDQAEGITFARKVCPHHPCACQDAGMHDAFDTCDFVRGNSQ